jgi:hypothetical protein
MHTSPDIAPPETPVTEKWVSQLRAEVEKTPTAGNVLALGTVGEHTDTTLIHKVIDSCTAESELAHACIIALENLGDRSNDGIRRIAPHLLIKKHHYSATRALTSAGGALAWQALFEDIKREFDFVTALNLINLSEHADAVKTLVLEKWSDHHGSDQTGMLRLLVTRIRDPTYRDAILQDPEVREFVHQLSTAAEGNFWFTGSKAAMIECLALFNSKAAVAAAHRCLENPQSHDRELYPGLLMRIDSAAGAELLIDVCTKEQQTGVRYAIGRALEDVEMTDRLLTAIASPDPAIREAACFLARWSKHDARLDEAIQARLDDSSHDVRTTALASRRFRADKVFAQELVVQLESESDPRRKTIFLDAFITLTDPGGENQELSPHLQRALDTVSSYEAHAAFERLKKRRKKLSENLKRMSRSS